MNLFSRKQTIMVLMLGLVTLSGWAGDPQLSPAVDTDQFLQANGNRLFLGKQEYRAIGVNMPFAATKAFSPKQEEYFSAAAGLEEAAKSGFAFIRIAVNPTSPEQVSWYLNNKEICWRELDAFFALSQRLNLKLIPTLNVFPSNTYLSHTGERRDSVVDPDSKTYKLIYAFVTEIVSRYKDDPNILMWELGNEMFLKADVPNFDCKDDSDRLTFGQLQDYYRQMTTHIKKLDPNHLVTSGDACVRKESMSRRLGIPFRPDTLREHLANSLNSQPEPLDVFSIHIYGPAGPGGKEKYRVKDEEGYALYPGQLRVTDYLMALVRVAHVANFPVFVGELGQAYPFFNEDPTTAWTCAMIDRLEAEEVSLIALWVWHFPPQPEHTFDSKSHPILVKRAVEFNRKHGTLPRQSTE